MSKKVSIIEDDPDILASIVTYLEIKSNYRIVSKHDGVEAFLDTPNLAPDLMLLDIGLKGMSGVEGLPHIKDKFQNLEVVMLTTYEETDVIFSALSAGASAYISKRSSLEKILTALDIVAEGGSYMSPGIAKKVVSHLNNQKSKTKFELSDRHKEIAHFIADGKSYKEIAELCFISLNTVRTHIKKIYSILQVNNKVQLTKRIHDGEV